MAKVLWAFCVPQAIAIFLRNAFVYFIRKAMVRKTISLSNVQKSARPEQNAATRRYTNENGDYKRSEPVALAEARSGMERCRHLSCNADRT